METKASSGSVAADPWADRRSERRQLASGEILLTRKSPAPSVVIGKLLDRSASGFRVGHRDSTLESGQVVVFHLGGDTGRARVVWNRIINGKVESGFLIVDGDAA